MQRYVGALCLLLAVSGASADEVGVELGPGFEYSGGDEALFLTYRRATAPLFECNSFVEFLGGSWNGSERDRMVGVARGLSFDLPDRGRFTTSLGAGYLDRTTENLGTHAQFLLQLGYERDVGTYVAGVGARHVSNGKKVFHWDGANKGENYLVVRIARRF